MKDYVNYCESMSNGNQDILALGGVISLISVLLANKFITNISGKKTYSNLYVVNLAVSGSGKSVPQNLNIQLLESSGLLCTSAYKSGAAFINGIPKQQNRLDQIDEFGRIIRLASSKNTGFQDDLADLMSQLYSAPGSMFGGTHSLSNKENGACTHPCVSVLGSTTPSAFNDALTKEIAEHGLIPRLLICYQKERGLFKEIDEKNASDCIASLQTFVDYLKSVKYRDIGKSVANQTFLYNPEIVSHTKEAKDFFLSIAKEIYETAGIISAFDSAFISRWGEHISKLSLIACKAELKTTIEKRHVEWAYTFVKAQWAAMKSTFSVIDSNSDFEKDMKKVLAFIEEKQPVSNRDICRRFHFDNKKLSDILNVLIKGEYIGHDKETKDSKKSTAYVTI
jgi:hypothetical protein